MRAPRSSRAHSPLSRHPSPNNRVFVGEKKKQSTPWRRKVGRLPKKKEPSTTRYAMRVYVATGADVPFQPSVIRMGLNFRMSVRISIGSAVLETRAVENQNGVCEVRGVRDEVGRAGREVYATISPPA